MKEFSIEQKAKRYDKAIERAKEINREHSKKGFKISDDVLYIFPELKENEDERVRNKLIEFFKGYSPDEEWWGNITQEDILAWLEKQGNLMKALQISNARIGELIEKNYYLKEQLEKQVENNMGISEATKQELEDNLNKALEKETPESCNEFLEEQVSEEFINALGTMLNDGLPDRYLVSEERIKKSAELLFSIARKQLKNDMQKWSEEDESRFNNLCLLINESNENKATKQRFIEFVHWLKSFRPQTTWKPSDEQMEALKKAIDGVIGDVLNWHSKDRSLLDSLYTDLKKLKL